MLNGILFQLSVFSIFESSLFSFNTTKTYAIIFYAWFSVKNVNQEDSSSFVVNNCFVFGVKICSISFVCLENFKLLVKKYFDLARSFCKISKSYLSY